MSQLTWDDIGGRTYETGVDHGVLYIPDGAGAYTNGVAWNGLVSVTESPSGAEANAQYADNIKYLNLFSAEDFGATIEAFTYPDEFAQFDGLNIDVPGVAVGQQPRRSFGLSYRSLFGNDLAGNEYGYKIHLIYGASASPSEKAYTTVNDSPEPITFSWELTTVAQPAGGTLAPTALIVIDSTKADSGDLAALELVLYGDVAVDPALPTPAWVLANFAGGGGTLTAIPPAPTYNSGTHVITIPSSTGITYYMDGVALTTGAQAAITVDKVVTARPNAGYRFPAGVDDDWFFDFV